VGWDNPLAMLAANWPIIPSPDDRWWWMCSSRWNENWQGKPKYSEKTCPSTTLSITNPTWPDLNSNLGRRRLTARAMAQPRAQSKFCIFLCSLLGPRRKCQKHKSYILNHFLEMEWCESRYKFTDVSEERSSPHFQGWGVSQDIDSKHRNPSYVAVMAYSSMLKDWRSTFCCNGGECLPDCMASLPDDGILHVYCCENLKSNKNHHFLFVLLAWYVTFVIQILTFNNFTISF
jgi:hypothetical protein